MVIVKAESDLYLPTCFMLNYLPYLALPRSRHLPR